MRLIDVDSAEISLTGITFNSTFTVRNKHEILAVMFEFESRPDCFEIEPLRGMILQGEKKVIKIRLKPEYRPQAEKISMRRNAVFIRATYYCEYNRKLLEAHQLRGWSSISRQFEESELPIRLCFEAEVEKLKQSYRQSSSLKNSRKQNSFEKFRDSSVKRAKNSKLNEDLDFLFRNEEYARLKSNQRVSMPNHQTLLSRNQPNEFKNEGRVGSHGHVQRVFEERGNIPKVGSRISTQSWGRDSMDHRSNNSRGFELIVLAVVAAVFLAIGQGIGSLLK